MANILRLVRDVVVWDEDHGTFDIAMTFVAEKSDELVLYTQEETGTSEEDVITVSEGIVEDAYTWYGITPP